VLYFSFMEQGGRELRGREKEKKKRRKKGGGSGAI
jgi:hypothetical protein